MSFPSPTKRVFDHVKYSDDLPREFLCDVCMKPILEAHMATPCGHSFCGVCVARFKKTNGQLTCAMCRQQVDNFCKNIFVCNVLSTFQGECLACKDHFSLDSSAEHIKKCPQMEIQCHLCGENFKRQDKALHEDACTMVEIVCECGKKFPRKDQRDHVTDRCDFTKTSCPLNCGQMIERYLIPSHTLQCTSAVEFCTIKGCGARVRRGGKAAHVENNQSRHYSLLLQEKKDILWRVSEVPRIWYKVLPKRSGEVAAFKWSLPSPPVDDQVICSPEFGKWKRKWKVFCVQKGGRLSYGIEYFQGVERIRVALSFLVSHQDGSSHVHHFPHARLDEGQMVRGIYKGTPKSITVKMELLEPVQQIDDCVV